MCVFIYVCCINNLFSSESASMHAMYPSLLQRLLILRQQVVAGVQGLCLQCTGAAGWTDENRSGEAKQHFKKNYEKGQSFANFWNLCLFTMQTPLHNVENAGMLHFEVKRAVRMIGMCKRKHKPNR